MKFWDDRYKSAVVRIREQCTHCSMANADFRGPDGGETLIGTALAEPPPFWTVLCNTRLVPWGVGGEVDRHQCAGTLSVAN